MKSFKSGLTIVIFMFLTIPLFGFTVSSGLDYTPNYKWGKNYYIKLPITDRLSIMPLFVESEVHKDAYDYYAYSGYALTIDYEIPLDYLSPKILSKIDYMFYSNISLGYGLVRIYALETPPHGDSLNYQRFFNAVYLSERNGIDINSVFAIENVNYISIYRDGGVNFVISPSLNFSVSF
ncbi:MAG: hypothetical protein GWP03_00170 [Proteobacteria bacterium]|nr:hypothetical protein [Pseudomonadota bacterium]